MKVDYLFVYGTLRKHGGSDFHFLLSKHSEYAGLATFQGKLFNIAYYPGVIESTNPNDQVLGELYKLNQPEHLLSTLDDYEECSFNHPIPHEYVREQKAILSQHLGLIKSWIYLYNYDPSTLEHIRTGDYLDFLRNQRTTHMQSHAD
jgi:gamma-glutamylcyclotransferase (GGCT)/AIG2-like uncharacterized protein YtfP